MLSLFFIHSHSQSLVGNEYKRGSTSRENAKKVIIECWRRGA